ncbi:MAG TPA: hypothetical protein VEU08_05090 [Vicinamibacterales bacterium]|nr:hypothetical protein [Vicinamibacterales bacterium]
MLCETTVMTILARHFPTAARRDIDDAARDVVLLDLLADDRIVVWEDSLGDRQDPACVPVFTTAGFRES